MVKMVWRILAVLILVGWSFTLNSAQAQEDKYVTADGVRKIVRDYLMEHPEVLQESIEALREKMRLQAETDARKNIGIYKSEMFDNKDDPVMGNPKGDVTIVEFFDYNCAFCKATYDALMDTVKADGKVRVVLKEFPILTDDSALASRIALSAKKQGKYEDLHRAYMKYRGKLDEKTAYKLAADVGLNMEQVKKDMASGDFDKLIRRNKEIARALGVDGTPTFIIGDRIVPQAIEASTLKQLIDLARKNEKPAQQPG
jgi:protein-disulfide isomerase